MHSGEAELRTTCDATLTKTLVEKFLDVEKTT